MSNCYLEYFYSRGLNNSTIENFKLGWCTPEGKAHPEELRAAIDPRFYDCVLFPIYDLYNNLVAVGARSPSSKQYIHTKYSKRKHLFGLNVTHRDIFEAKRVYVVEGNFDLLTLWQNGVKNVVAMLGSQLSNEQLALLTRFAEEVVIASDGDEAGKDCAEKLSELMRANDVKFKVLRLPYGNDPDSFVRKNGIEAFRALEPKGLLQHLKEIEI
jgi:DNA primase